MYSSVILGETTDIGCQLSHRKGDDFTISAATVEIQDSAGNVVVAASTAASVDGDEVFYSAAFTSPTYAVGTYVAIFTIDVTDGTTTSTEIHRDYFEILAGETP